MDSLNRSAILQHVYTYRIFSEMLSLKYIVDLLLLELVLLRNGGYRIQSSHSASQSQLNKNLTLLVIWSRRRLLKPRNVWRDIVKSYSFSKLCQKRDHFFISITEITPYYPIHYITVNHDCNNFISRAYLYSHSNIIELDSFELKCWKKIND